MKNVTQMIPRAATALQSTQPLPPPTQPLGVVDDQTGDVIEKIFRQLQAIFPAWKQAWPDDKALSSAQRSWTKGFVGAGIRTIEQVRFGIEQCRRSRSPFAPSIGQFIEWCTPGPEHFGMPAVGDAWMEALMESYTHPAVKAAANATGLFDLRAARQENKGLRERFERNYQIVLRRVQAGQPVDGKILVGIGHDSQKTELELASEHAEREAQERIAAQGIPADGQSARELLLSRFGKKAGVAHA